ncbi:hypothetical protein L1987_47773 [Smallanthus sonchifolius]|uniref:Uncharacterized protein n=1 Tax=Smallanthus sonchifolius TaxID=185202 RepID=A0ACB9FQN2_9ASTR|nr:hypothetical protein L1987_47773 [Smallanthus sonchifolius]
MAWVCDLCHHQQPSLYCSSDSAFLCFDCDSQVHTANFLVARHIRLPICKPCDDDDVLSSSSSSSSTVCKTTSASSSDWKTKDVLLSWSSRLGGNSSVIEAARQAFQVWWANRSGWPYRVGLAASLWLGLLRFTKEGDSKKRILKRLKEISGVPAKWIVVQQSKLAKMMKHTTNKRRASNK